MTKSRAVDTAVGAWEGAARTFLQAARADLRG